MRRYPCFALPSCTVVSLSLPLSPSPPLTVSTLSSSLFPSPPKLWHCVWHAQRLHLDLAYLASWALLEVRFGFHGGLDFMGPFIPGMAQTCNQNILVATDYYTKWVEAKALWDNMKNILYENIWCQFSYPIELDNNQGKFFINEVLASFTSH